MEIVGENFRWGGGKYPDGGWEYQIDATVLRFEHIRSLSSYERLNALKPIVRDELGSDHKLLLKAVCAKWKKKGRWPYAMDFMVSYRRRGDALLLLSEIPLRFLRREQWSCKKDARIVLTLEGLDASGVMGRELGEFILIQNAACQEYAKGDGETTLTIDTLAELTSIAPTRIARMIELISWEYCAFLRIDRSSLPLTVKPEREILDIGPAKDFSAFLKRRATFQSRDR